MPPQTYKEKMLFIYREEFNFYVNFRTPLSVFSIFMQARHLHAHKSSAQKWDTRVFQQMAQGH